MKASEISRNMRKLEAGRYGTISENAFAIVRLTCHQLEGNVHYPYVGRDGQVDQRDKDRNEAMLESMIEVACFFNSRLSYTFGNEISVLIPKDFSSFDRRIDKIVSVASSLCSQQYAIESGRSVYFEGAVYEMPSLEFVEDYFRWRRAEAANYGIDCVFRSALRGVNAVEEGFGNAKKQAAKIENQVRVTKLEERKRFIATEGYKLNQVPLWIMNGTMLFQMEGPTDAYNPVSRDRLVVIKPQPFLSSDIAAGNDFGEFIEALPIPHSVSLLTQ